MKRSVNYEQITRDKTLIVIWSQNTRSQLQLDATTIKGETKH